MTMRVHLLRSSAAAWAVGTMLAGSPVLAKSDILPYVEVDQVVDVDLDGHGDTVTYTTVAAGIDGSVQTRRLQATFDYRYEKRIPWDDKYGDQDVHYGLARGAYALVPGMLSLEGGALATRARSDIRGTAPSFLSLDRDNVSQVYGGYVGPSFSHRFGELDTAAAYQFGYVKVEEKDGVRLPAGQVRFDSFDHSTSHNVTASIGMPTGNSLLPFGWTISGGFQREDISQLDQRFDTSFARLDIVQPVSPTLALTAGVGYENIELSAREPLRDANGNLVLDGNGRLRTDPNAPRTLSYDSDGLIYDGGVIWRPNRRTEAQLRVGHRYGGTLVLGTLNYQMTSTEGVQVRLYNGIESFGGAVTAGLATLPTSFTFTRTPISEGFGGCVFGTDPGTGTCFDRAFQAITSGVFRSRGVDMLYTAKQGPWTFGFGAGYARRRYLGLRSSTIYSLAGLTDESAFIQASASRRLTPNSGIDTSLFATWYQSGVPGSPEVIGSGATGSYYRDFGNRLTGRASVGVWAADQEGFQTDVNGQLLLGMRYTF